MYVQNKGDLSVQSLAAHSIQYDKQNSMGSSVLNGSASDCVLIQSLNQGINSSANSTNSSVVAEAQDYVKNLTIQFQSTSDAPSRLGLLISSFAKLSGKCRILLKSIKMQGISFDCIMADVVAAGAAVSVSFASLII